MRLARVFFAAVLLASVGFGQSDRGSITGTVADPSGSVVAVAKIDARNVDNGATYTANATATGNYELPQLPTGNYEMTVTANGFKRYIKQNIFIPVTQTVRIDVTLEVGSTSDTVTVTDTAPILKTESGEISHNIKIDDINALPILQIGATIRSPYASANLIPGMNWNLNGTGASQNLRVNGLPSNTQSFRVDGQDSTNGIWQIQSAQVQPSVDGIQEMAIQTSNFAAEFGQAGGGVFNLTMKSGTNQFHGTGYDYITNEALNAGLAYTSNTAAGRPNEHIRNRARQHDYGFAIGGPVKIPHVYNGKDRTFFFFNFEQRRAVNFISNGLYTVPTLAMRNGDFSNQGLAAPRTFSPGSGLAPIIEGQIFDPNSNLGLAQGFVVRAPFTGNIIPSGRIDPIAQKIQALLPLPNTGGPNSVFQNYAVPTYAVPTVQSIPSVKIDQNLGPLMKLSGYWSTNRLDSPGGDGLPDPISTRTVSSDRTHTIRLNYDYTMKPTLLLHIGAGMVHVNSFSGAPGIGDTSLLVPNVNNKNYLSYFSAINAGARGGFIGAGAQATSAIGPQLIRTFKNEKPSANVSLTWVRNNHTYKAGGEAIFDGYVAAVESFSNGNFAFSTNETSQPYLQSASFASPFTPGHNYASFLLGAVDSGTTAAVANSRLGNHALGFFLQDTFKVSRKLTLDYGVRYDFTTYLREQYGRIPAWSGTVPNPKILTASGTPLLGGVAYEGFGIAGHCNCDLAKNYPYAIGPRLGIAYQINSKTVFRGGAGYNYGKAPEFGWLGGSINGTTNFATSNPYSAKFNLKDGLNVNAVFPSVDPAAFPVTPAGRETPTYVIDQNAGRPGRILTWSIGLQREVTHDLVVEASYVGNRGVWLQSNISQVNALTAERAASFGFDIHNAADLAVLGTPISQSKDPRVKIPYVGFPTNGPVYSALRPFPQFNSNLQLLWSPTGKSWYDSLQAKVTKRYSHGLNLQGAFTWQKELQISAENSYALFGFANGAGTFQNNVTAYNQNKYLSIQSRPLQLVFSASYQTPKWNVNKYVGLITGDWQIATVLRYQSGSIIQLPSTNNNYNNQIGRGGTLAERVPGVPVFLNDPNCNCFDPTKTLVLNRAAFRQTPAGQFSASTPYYNDLRNARIPSESFNFGRNFRVRGADSRMNLQLRAEFTNIFNRRYLPTISLANPNGLTVADVSNPTTGLLTSGFGFANPAGGAGQLPRTGTLVARFTF